MTKEAHGSSPISLLHDTDRLKALLLSTLDANGGLCLDSKDERQQLAAALAIALIAAARDETQRSSGSQARTKKIALARTYN